MVTISTYLQGRKHNSQLLTKLAEDHITPIIEAFNDNHDPISAEWSMSAKHQSITIEFRMTDDSPLSRDALDLITDGNIYEFLTEYFAVEPDEDDAKDTYFSIDLGL